MTKCPPAGPGAAPRDLPSRDGGRGPGRSRARTRCQPQAAAACLTFPGASAPGVTASSSAARSASAPQPATADDAARAHRSPVPAAPELAPCRTPRAPRSETGRWPETRVKRGGPCALTGHGSRVHGVSLGGLPGVLRRPAAAAGKTRDMGRVSPNPRPGHGRDPGATAGPPRPGGASAHRAGAGGPGRGPRPAAPACPASQRHASPRPPTASRTRFPPPTPPKLPSATGPHAEPRPSPSLSLGTSPRVLSGFPLAVPTHIRISFSLTGSKGRGASVWGAAGPPTSSALRTRWSRTREGSTPRPLRGGGWGREPPCRRLAWAESPSGTAGGLGAGHTRQGAVPGPTQRRGLRVSSAAQRTRCPPASPAPRWGAIAPREGGPRSAPPAPRGQGRGLQARATRAGRRLSPPRHRPDWRQGGDGRKLRPPRSRPASRLSRNSVPHIPTPAPMSRSQHSPWITRHGARAAAPGGGRGTERLAASPACARLWTGPSPSPGTFAVTPAGAGCQGPPPPRRGADGDSEVAGPPERAMTGPPWDGSLGSFPEVPIRAAVCPQNQRRRSDGDGASPREAGTRPGLFNDQSNPQQETQRLKPQPRAPTRSTTR